MCDLTQHSEYYRTLNSGYTFHKYICSLFGFGFTYTAALHNGVQIVKCARKIKLD